MKEIINLAGYEYKKILGRKSTWIAFGILFLLVLLGGFGTLTGDVWVEGEKVDTHYNMNQKECRALREMKGKKLDDNFFDEAREIRADVINEADGQQELLVTANGWDNYCRYYIPYRNIESLCLWHMETEMEKMDEETFYRKREEAMQGDYEAQKLSQEEIDFHEKENTQVETPFSYGNMMGFERYFSLQYTMGLILAFVAAVCIAPLFAGEYTSGMDQMILSARYGKNKVIQAKLLTGISFALMLTISVFGLTLVEIGMIYGFDGWNLPVQVINEGFCLSLSINMLQMLAISLMCGIFASCMIIAVVMFLSVKMKTPFGVIILAFLFIFVPMVLNNMVPIDSIWYMFVKGTPTAMMMSWVGVSYGMIQIGKCCLYFFQAIPVVYTCLMTILFVWIYHSFRRRQAG